MTEQQANWAPRLSGPSFQTVHLLNQSCPQLLISALTANNLSLEVF